MDTSPPDPEPAKAAPAEPRALPARRVATLAKVQRAAIKRRPLTGGPLALSFEEPERFHASVGRAVMSAGLGGLIAGLVAEFFLGGPSLPLLITLALAGALSGIPRNKRKRLFGSVLGTIGGLLQSLCPPWLGGLAVGALAAPVLAEGESFSRRVATGAFAGLLGASGLYVTRVLLEHGVVDAWLPVPLASAALGSVLGLFVGLGGAPKHLNPASDPVERAFTQFCLRSSGEVKEIVERASAAYLAIHGDLTRRDPAAGRTLGPEVSVLSLRILDIAESCQEIERDLGETAGGELERRIAAYRKRSAESPDEAARATFAGVVESLLAQERVIASTRAGLERVLARLHANVAQLEAMRFSLVRARSADAERIGSESSPLAESIAALSRELDLTSSAMGEVFGEAALPAPHSGEDLGGSPP